MLGMADRNQNCMTEFCSIMKKQVESINYKILSHSAAHQMERLTIVLDPGVARGCQYTCGITQPTMCSVHFQIKRKERERAEKADSKDRGGGGSSEDKDKAATAELSS